MLKVYYLSNHSPDPDGGGGYHRTYQVNHDLISVFGKNSITIPIIIGKNSSQPQKFLERIESLNYRLWLTSKIWKLGFKPSEVFDHLIEKNRTGNNIFRRISLASYIEFLNSNGNPDICVIDNAKYLPLVRANKEKEIPTVFCPHNLDTFDLSSHLLENQQARIRCGTSLIYELDSIVESSLTFVISKLEKTIMDGLGVSTEYYPYLPVGEIRNRLMEIRKNRASSPVDPSLYFLFGSINHTTTYESFKWFLSHVKKEGLPQDCKIHVAGRGCEVLEKDFPNLPGVTFLGQLKQEDLNQELESVRCILIPQLSGFGAVTRISEMACAGIPMIISEHTTNALDIPPNTRVVPNDWSSWKQAIRSVQSSPVITPEIAEYEKWESAQPNPILEKVARLI